MYTNTFIEKFEGILDEIKEIYNPNIEDINDYSDEDLENLYYSILTMTNLFSIAFRKNPIHLNEKTPEEVEQMRNNYVNRILNADFKDLDALDIKIRQSTELRKYQNL